MLFVFMIILAVIHTYYLTPLFSQDEIWIYGFGTNIVDGLIPYKDYNMVVTPFFPYLLSIIFRLFCFFRDLDALRFAHSTASAFHSYCSEDTIHRRHIE